MQKYMAGPVQNAWSNFGPFQEYTVIYGGIELLHGWFKQEETHTHTDTPGVKSLRGWRGWMPYYPLTSHSRTFTLGFCHFCNF